MKKGYFLMAVITAVMAGLFAVGCSSDGATTPEEEPTLVPVSTATATSTPMKIDDFEASTNPTDPNMLGGDWESGKNASSVNTVTLETGAASTTKSKQMAGNVTGVDPTEKWPYISMATSISYTAEAVDVSGFTGLRLYMKGAKGAGDNTAFLIQLIVPDTMISDGSTWRYTWTPNASWTQVTIPWTSFNAPNWGGTGQGEALTRQQILENVTAIQWAISDVTEGGFGVSTGHTWSVDEIELY